MEPREPGAALVRPLVVLLGLAAVLSAPLDRPAAASCVAPYLQVDGQEERFPAVLASGSSVVVEGRSFSFGCNDEPDAATTGGGCAARDEGTVDDVRQMEDVELVVVQDGRRWRLGAADAGRAADGEQGQLTWSVTLPDGLQPGRATLRAVPEESVPTQALEVRVVR